MLGAVEAALIATGIVRLVYINHIDPIRAELHTRMGEHAYREAMRRGTSIPLDQAVADLARLIQDTPGNRAESRDTNRYALTPREQEVLRLLATRKSDKEIADALYIGVRTVQTHVSNVLAKLDAHNRAEAAALAVRDDLV